MNIPYSILKKKNILDNNCYEYHQHLAKYFYILNKNKSPTQNKSNKYSRKKIYKWFFSLDIKNKFKICSIYNNWFIKILGQLMTYYSYDHKICFKVKKAYEDFYKIFDSDFKVNEFNYEDYIKKEIKELEGADVLFNTFFESEEIQYNNIEGENNEMKSRNEYMEKEFLNELRFFSINKYNDIIVLNEELLKDNNRLQQYFDKFSNCSIFLENIKVIKQKINSNNNIYNFFNFTIPSWISNYKIFTIPQLIVICLEISISIYYQIFIIENAIPQFDIDSKIHDFYNKKLNMENFLGKEIYNKQNQINSIFDSKQLSNEIDTEKYINILTEYDKIIEFVYIKAFDHKQSAFYTNSREENIINTLDDLKKELKNNISQFVNTISFIRKDHIFKIENIIYNIIYQKIDSLCSNRNLDELCNVDNETSKHKKKKKRNKKNKNEKKEEINENIEEKEKNSDDNKDIINYENNEFSINAVDNKNNSNNSKDEEEDEYGQIFSSDYQNEIDNSMNNKNIEKDEEKIKECIEMKYLDDKGKEILNDEKEKEKEKSDKDSLEELLMETTQEKKKNNKKKKKHRNKNKNKKKNNIQEEMNKEIKNEEKKEEPKEEEKNIEKDLKIENIKEKKEIISQQNIEENKNKKKQKDFFLYPVDTKKGKKNKINNNKKNISDKSCVNNDDNKLQIDINEKKEINEIKNIKDEASTNVEEKKFDFCQTKENDILFIGNKKEKSLNIFDKSNKIEHTHEFTKIQNFNLNNSTINNYVIIDKISTNESSSLENKDFQKNIFPTFNYSMPYHQLPNYYLYERSELFNDLTEEILSHEKSVTNNLNLLKKFREEIYQKILHFIENILNKNNIKVKLNNYGSHETGLSTEFSDIDILIKFCKNDNINNICLNSQQNIEEILSLIYNGFYKEKEKYNIIQINAISTASVPVIKIKCNLEDIIPYEIKNKIKENYLFNFEEDILQFNFDFTFQEVEKIDSDKKIPSLEIIPYIKNCLNVYKEIKPIMLILKRFIKINKLNLSFQGGLSSYSLFLLLYSYIKSVYIPNNSLGLYLYSFFEFYSNFNFGIYSINPKLECPFILLDELHECGMMLIDPITSLNVAKSTHKIDQIKSVLTKGMISIRNIILTNKNKDYIHNLNYNKYIFLNELFKSRNGTLIFDKLIPQFNLINPNNIGNWKNK